MGREPVTKTEWCPGSPVCVFREGKGDQLCQMLTDKDYKDRDVTVAFGHTEVTDELDKSTCSKGA